MLESEMIIVLNWKEYIKMINIWIESVSSVVEYINRSIPGNRKENWKFKSAT